MLSTQTLRREKRWVLIASSGINIQAWPFLFSAYRAAAEEWDQEFADAFVGRGSPKAKAKGKAKGSAKAKTSSKKKLASPVRAPGDDGYADEVATTEYPEDMPADLVAKADAEDEDADR